MLKSYLKTAIRNLLNNKQYIFINVIGLGVGISVCLLIFIVIQFELSFDNFHHKKDRINRVLTKFEGNSYASGVPGPLPVALKNDFPQFDGIAAVVQLNMQVMSVDNGTNSTRKFRSKIFFTEPSLFKILDFKWLIGSPGETLGNPNSVALSKATAEKYFGDWKRAIGQTIKLDNRFLLNITGIIDDSPANTDFQFKIVAPYNLLGFMKSHDWVSIDDVHQCYVLLPEAVQASAVNRQLEVFSRKYRPVEDKTTQELQPLEEVHYDSRTKNFLGKTMGRDRIRLLWLIAIFILLIACINFINLSTAQAINRAKEVGVRKALGSSRSQLTIQFLLESMLLVIMAVILAMVITAASLYKIGQILDIPLSFSVLYNPFLFLFLLIVIVLVTLLAGFYPSLVLSSFNPILALKSKLTAKRTKGVSLRHALVMFQFIIAQGLIIATFIILRQMNYFKNSTMGFDKEAIVNIPFPNDSVNIRKIGYLHDRITAIKGVQKVTFCNSAPASDDNWWTPLLFNHAPKETDFFAAYRWIDDSYLPTYKLALVAGRNITRTDSITEFLVNEELARKLGFSDPQEILNKEIDIWGGSTKGPVVGVVKNFHVSSLKEGLTPMFMSNVTKFYRVAGIKLDPAQLSASMGAIEGVWNNLFPEYVFEYEFLDDKIDSFYKQEKQLSQLCEIFSIVAIFLSCLGLFGLASFMALQRTKEVGIRKVLGATGGNIVYLFSKEFLVLIGIAFVIASSVTWYFMHQWLENYAYRTNISWWIFLSGGLMSLLVALTTVSFHAIKAAMINPIKSLRSE